MGAATAFSARYLDLCSHRSVALSLAATNDYGYVHRQTLDLLSSRRIRGTARIRTRTITITVRCARRFHGFRWSVERRTCADRVIDRDVPVANGADTVASPVIGQQ
jgi:hypothetical protein